MANAQLKTKVLVVDDHPAMRDGLRQIIEAEEDMMVIGEAGEGMTAIDLFLQLKPDVVLMDIQMPGVGGLEAISAIHGHVKDAAIVVLTTYPGDARATRAMTLGATSYLLKSASSDAILAAIRSAMHGRSVLEPVIAKEIEAHKYAEKLTARELEVLHLIARGNTNIAIADALHVSEQTIKTHVKSILAKLGANDRTHAIALATRRGFIDA